MATDDDYELISAPTDDDYELITPPPTAQEELDLTNRFLAEANAAEPKSAPEDQLTQFENLSRLPDRNPITGQTAVQDQVETEVLKQIPLGKAPYDPLGDITSLDSVGRGAAQAGTGGFHDEMVAGIKATGKSAYDFAKQYIADGGEPEGWLNAYRRYRGQERVADAKADLANPTSYAVGQVGAGLAVPGSGAKQLITQGGLYGLGSSEADLTDPSASNLQEAAKDTAVGAGISAGAQALAPVAKWAGGKASDAAQSLAKRAAGVTGRHANELSDEAAQALLDQGTVKFGGTTSGTLKRVAAKDIESGTKMGEDLAGLDALGAKVSITDRIANIEKEILDLQGVPGSNKYVKQLQKQIKDLQALGVTEVPISVSEQGKRMFDSQTNFNSAPNKQQAAKALGTEFRNAGEEAALAADPKLGQQFINNKNTNAYMKQTLAAADHSAKQPDIVDSLIKGAFSQPGGAAGGALYSGYNSDWDPTEMAKGAVAGSLFSRLPSSGAVGFDVISKILKKAPQMLGKYAPILQKAAAKSPQAFSSQTYVLQNKDPEFRKLMQDLSSTENQPIDATNME